jgi:hypothetical protein
MAIAHNLVAVTVLAVQRYSDQVHSFPSEENRQVITICHPPRLRHDRRSIAARLAWLDDKIQRTTAGGRNSVDSMRHVTTANQPDTRQAGQCFVRSADDERRECCRSPVAYKRGIWRVALIHFHGHFLDWV